MYLHECVIKPKKRWPYKRHALHLLTNKIKWITQFVNVGLESPLVVSISNEKNQGSNLFVVVHLDDYSDADTENVADDLESLLQPPIKFFCHHEFLEHYNLDVNEKFTFAVAKVFPLVKVTIAALTEQTYEWAKQKMFETGLLVSTTCSGQILARFNDTFLASPCQSFGSNPTEILARFKELTVIGCNPLQQGLINFQTRVVVVKLENPQLAIENDSEQGDSYLEGINVSVMNNTSEFSGINTIFLSSLFCNKLNIEDGEYVSININGSTELSQKERSVCKVSIISQKFNLSSDELVNNYTIYLSTNTWFNVIGKQSVTNTNNWTCKIEKLDEKPSYAAEIHLSLILSPRYSPSVSSDSSLMKFFAVPQVVRNGDVISLDVSGDCEFHENADIKTSRCRTLHYLISKLHKGTDCNEYYLVDLKQTSIYQEGTVNSYIPPVSPFNWNANIPTGLEKYSNILQEMMNPYLHLNGSFDHTCSILVSGQSGCGKWSVVSRACRASHLHLVQVDCHSLTSDTPGASEAKIKEAFRRASTYSPCLLYLQNLNVLGKNRENETVDNRACSAFISAFESLHSGNNDQLPVIVVAAVEDVMCVVEDIRMQFLHQVQIEAPTEAERRQMAKHVTSHLCMSNDVDFNWIAKHSAGFVFSDFWQLMKKTVVKSHSRIIKDCAVGCKLSFQEEENLSLAGVTSVNDDVLLALKEMQNDRADSIGVPKIPEVKWNEIGGLDDVKTHILETIQLPLDCPELVKSGLNRSGVLLYGPPGTGKTLLAKAVASQCSLSFLSVKGPELINMYVGQSEENVRRVFQRARDAAPCVVFFDELDALAPNRGKSGDSGGVMDRVVSQLLAELDGVNTCEDKDKLVFIIAASNRPDLIDTALLRPGRLDKLLYVGISENKYDQLKILIAQTRKLNLAPAVCLRQVVEKCPSNMTGADFYALTSEAAMNAVRRHIRKLESLTGSVLIEQDDFLQAAANVVPSVNAAQLENYRSVKSKMDR